MPPKTKATISETLQAGDGLTTATCEGLDILFCGLGRLSPLLLPIVVAIASISSDKDELSRNNLAAHFCLSGCSFDVWAIATLASPDIVMAHEARDGIIFLALFAMVIHAVAPRFIRFVWVKPREERSHRFWLVLVTCLGVGAPLLIFARIAGV